MSERRTEVFVVSGTPVEYVLGVGETTEARQENARGRTNITPDVIVEKDWGRFPPFPVEEAVYQDGDIVQATE